MDLQKIATESCLKVGLSRMRSIQLGSEIAAAIIKEQQKIEVKDITEVKDTYKRKPPKEKKEEEEVV